MPILLAVLVIFYSATMQTSVSGCILLYVTFALLTGSVSGGLNPDLLQRTLAEVNLHGFPESLLYSSFERDMNKKLSKEELQRLLASPEGQDLARIAAMQIMLDHAPPSSGEQSRSMQGWLSGMCDSIPWISWLVACDEDNYVEKEREHPEGAIPLSPYLISLQNFVWATCVKEGSSSSNEV